MELWSKWPHASPSAKGIPHARSVDRSNTGQQTSSNGHLRHRPRPGGRHEELT